MAIEFGTFMTFYSQYKNDNSEERVLKDIDIKIGDKIRRLTMDVRDKEYSIPLCEEWDALADGVNRHANGISLKLGNFVITIWPEGIVYTEYLEGDRMNTRMTMGEDEAFDRTERPFMPTPSWDNRIIITTRGEVIPRGRYFARYEELLLAGKTDDVVKYLISLFRLEIRDMEVAR